MGGVGETGWGHRRWAMGDWVGDGGDVWRVWCVCRSRSVGGFVLAYKGGLGTRNINTGVRNSVLYLEPRGIDVWNR